jgi:hypothetical protein
MTRIIIAGDSWGAHSYEEKDLKNDLKGFRWAPKKNYILYPGPGHFLSKRTKLEVITTADHGVSNTEAFDNLNKIDYKDDIIVFYKTGLFREIHRAHINKKQVHATKNFENDMEYYSDKFYKRCSEIEAKHFCLIGGCVQIQKEQAKKYNINVIEHSITKLLCPEFTDHDFDPTTYWLEFQYASKKSYGLTCEYFKKGVLKSHGKIEVWKNKDGMFWKNHPTVASNKKIALRIYKYLRDKKIL